MDWAWLAVALIAVVFWLGQRNQGDRPAATTAEGILSIVALPSKVVAQASDQFLTDAIPKTISAHLTQVTGLETKMPPSSVEVERVRGDLGRLADLYGVNAFVLTSLTADTDRLVLNVQLVEARSRRLRWSRDFEGRRDGYLALARGAAEELRGECGRRPRRSSRRARRRTRTRSWPTSAACTTSTAITTSTNRRTSRGSRGLPGGAETGTADGGRGCRIAWMHLFTIEASTPVEQGLPLMRQWAQRALEMDERNSRAWSVKAVAEFLATPSRQRDALVAGLRAATYGPRDAFAVNVVGVALQGPVALLCLASMQEAARLDPLYLYPRSMCRNCCASSIDRRSPWPTRTMCCGIEPDMPIALIRKALTLVELGRSADLAALIPTLQRQVAEGRNDGQRVGW